MNFSSALKRWNNGISRGAQTRFAKAVGYNQGTVARWASGSLAPGEDAIPKIARILKVSEPETARMFSVRTEVQSDSDLRKEVELLREEVSHLKDLVTAALHLEKGSLRKT